MGDDMDLVRGTSAQSKRMEGHFVRTNSDEGLTDANAQLAMRLLLSQSSKPHAIQASESHERPVQHGTDKGQTRAVSALLSPLPARGRLTLMDRRLGKSVDEDALRPEPGRTTAARLRALSPLPNCRAQQLDGAPLHSPLPSIRRLVKVVI